MLSYGWKDGDTEHELRLVPVPGTAGTPYLFGAEPNRLPIEVRDFHISSTPVTQALWTHVMGASSSERPHPLRPADNVAWDEITGAGGFLERINSSAILTAIAGPGSPLRFRLPSETEWEYAARGGPHWRDNFAFSGSSDPDAVAWYGRRWSGGALKWEILKQLKWLKLWGGKPTRAHDVATKASNQLGLYDMSGNVWEWCQDTCVDPASVPRDGTPALDPSPERRLRGGCHHNWDFHCTVWWRYSFPPEARGGAIGFRVVLASDVFRV